MRLFYVVVLATFFAQNPINLFSQNTFQQNHITAGENTGIARMAASADGSVFYASTVSLASGRTVALLSHVDANGQLKWAKSWGAMDVLPNLADVCAMPSGGAVAILTSYLNSGTVQSDLIAVNASGDMLWSKRLLQAENWLISSLHAVQGGFLATLTFTGSLDRAALIKIDANGNTLWSRQYNNIRLETRTLFEDTNNDLYMTGQASIGVALLRISANGDVLHARQISGNNFDLLALANSCSRTTDDSLVISGYDFDGRTILLKTDRLGNVGSTRVLENLTGNNLLGIGAYPDKQGNLLLGLLEDGSAPTHAMLAKIGPQLGLQWVKEFGDGPGNRFTYCLEPSQSDGGLWLGGQCDKGSGTFKSCILVKTDYNGTMFDGCCPKSVELVAEPFAVISNPLTVTPQPGFSLGDQTWANENIAVDIEPLCNSLAIEEILSDTTETICPGACTVFSLKNAQQGGEYRWYFEGGTPDSSKVANPGQVCYGPVGNYRVILTDENGCFLDSTSVVVSTPPDKFPNAFAPGGFNTTFRPLIDCPVEDYHLEIFNRWGDLVFESFERLEEWDGTVNGKPAPMDTYIYRVQFFAQRNGARTLVYEAKKELLLIR